MLYMDGGWGVRAQRMEEVLENEEGADGAAAVSGRDGGRCSVVAGGPRLAQHSPYLMAARLTPDQAGRPELAQLQAALKAK